jgi:outer membrane biosynthesis protein TonB
MQQSAGNVGLLPRRDEHFGHAARRASFAPTSAAPEGVTVCLSGAVLAPAPAAAVTGLVAKIEEAPVFVDDSGSRKRLLRIVGVLIGLLSIGFISIVGVALAVPNVATSVGLGDVVPFVVPGAAAPPPPKAPEAPKVQAKPKPKPKPAVVKPKPVVEAPEPKPAPVVEAPVVEAPVVEAPVVEPPVVEPPVVEPPVVEPPVVEPPAPGTGDGQTGDQTGQTGQTGGQPAQTGQTGGETGQTGGQAPQGGEQVPANAPVAEVNAAQ